MSFLELFLMAAAGDFLVLLEFLAAFAGAERDASVAGREEVGYSFWVFFANLAVVRRFEAADEFA